MKYVLKEMTSMEKPREKLYQFGAESFADYPEPRKVLLRNGCGASFRICKNKGWCKGFGYGNRHGNHSYFAGGKDEGFSFDGIGDSRGKC